MERLIHALLADDNGISDTAFEALFEYVEDTYAGKDPINYEIYRGMLRRADATDGRFYYPSDKG